jgi:hypothetical protein
MQYGEAHVRMKLESCFLEGVLVCVCGMPSSPVSIYVHDGGYYANCSTCSAILSVEHMPLLFDQPVKSAAFDQPGISLNFDRSDVFMVLHCVCGDQSQVYGKGRGEIECGVCRLSYFVSPRLSIRALPADARFDFSNSEAPMNPINPINPMHSYINLQEEADANDVPDVSERLAAFKLNPLRFWASVWRKDDADPA